MQGCELITFLFALQGCERITFPFSLCVFQCMFFVVSDTRSRTHCLYLQLGSRVQCNYNKPCMLQNKWSSPSLRSVWGFYEASPFLCVLCILISCVLSTSAEGNAPRGVPHRVQGNVDAAESPSYGLMPQSHLAPFTSLHSAAHHMISLRLRTPGHGPRARHPVPGISFVHNVGSHHLPLTV